MKSSRTYKGCSAFVFPSWHEGFGLPALEAMAAGAAVIAANTSSLPEVVGQEEALFDPFDVDEIKAKLEQVLTDQAFAQKLRDHAPVQAAKFSWQHTAEQASAFFQQTVEAYSAGSVQHDEAASRERWPERAAERLSVLLKHIAEALRAEANVKRRARVMSQVAAALDRNEQELLRLRLQKEGAISPWLIEGPFDSSYSLALLNRELARALRDANIDVQLRSSEGPGDFDPDPAFLGRNPDLADGVAAETVAGLSGYQPLMIRRGCLTVSGTARCIHGVGRKANSRASGSGLQHPPPASRQCRCQQGAG